MDIPTSSSQHNVAQKVIGFGEALLDIIVHRDGNSVALPGGSVLNSMVSLARSGVPVALISELGNDGPGKIIRFFLQKEGISTEFIQPIYNGQTALAFAALDDNRNASYTFYKQYPQVRCFERMPILNASQVLLFGSFYAIQAPLQATLHQILSIAIEAGSLLFYDPNIRSHSIHSNSEAMQIVKNHCSRAHIIRGSDEDFLHLFGTDDICELFELIQPSVCKLMVVSRAHKGVSAFNGVREFVFDVPKVDVVTTVGAGDAMNAGMINYWIKNSFELSDSRLSTPFQSIVIEEMIKSGIEMATAVCSSNENYISR
jgi:fructokinase